MHKQTGMVERHELAMSAICLFSIAFLFPVIVTSRDVIAQCEFGQRFSIEIESKNLDGRLAELHLVSKEVDIVMEIVAQSSSADERRLFLRAAGGGWSWMGWMGWMDS